MKISIFHAVITLITFVIGVCILCFGDSVPFIRYSLGDFIIVIFIYSLIKSLWPGIDSIWLASGVFLFSLTIEILQYFEVTQIFDSRKIWVQVLLGSSFEWFDIVMYLAGIATILWIEKIFWNKRN